MKYALAKYVADRARNEPINVGVILTDGSSTVARFDGENDIGKIDGRRLGRIGAPHAYGAWVAHWRRMLDQEPNEVGTAFDALPLGASADFYLEFGGEVILDHSEQTLAAALSSLYERLVRAPERPKTGLLARSKHALQLAGAPVGDKTRFKERATVALQTGGETEVSFAVKNGRWHYVEAVSLDAGKPKQSQKDVHNAAFVFEHARGIDRGVVLYDAADPTKEQEVLISTLEQYADPIDISDPDKAAAGLAHALHL